MAYRPNEEIDKIMGSGQTKKVKEKSKSGQGCKSLSLSPLECLVKHFDELKGKEDVNIDTLVESML